jgi:bla regulator protein blaR1
MTYANLSPLANHLWQSTIFAGAMWVLTLALRQNRAAVRYWLWLAASVKILIPFSLLVGTGSHLWRRTASEIEPSQWSFLAEQISQPFPTSATAPQVLAPPMITPVPAILFGIWLYGVAVGIVFWFRSSRKMRAVRQAATPLDLGLPISAACSSVPVEPGVFGIRKPILLLPEGITEHLTPAQLAAIVRHEMCHVRRRDNLTASLHMLVEILFWFYPLVWWIRTRLLEERENACDEEVLKVATDPEAYAEGILSVCKFYLQAPSCVAGAAGPNLRKRLERILSRRLADSLSLPKKLLLLGVGLCAIAGPVAIGLFSAPVMRAQPKPKGRLTFEVASVKPAPPDADERSLSHNPGARLSTSNATLKQLVLLAYQLMPYQVSGGPDWVGSDGFDIEAKAANPKATPEQFRQMVQTLLADRFQLKVHFATKEMPIYALVLAGNGSKLVEAKDDTTEVTMRNGRGEMTGVKATMAMFAASLTRPLRRRVVDETGLKGAYTFKLQFVPDENPVRPGQDGAAPSTTDGPSLFTALREQLGLTLKATKGPVEVLVIDHAEKPTPN